MGILGAVVFLLFAQGSLWSASGTRIVKWNALCVEMEKCLLLARVCMCMQNRHFKCLLICKYLNSWKRLTNNRSDVAQGPLFVTYLQSQRCLNNDRPWSWRNLKQPPWRRPLSKNWQDQWISWPWSCATHSGHPCLPWAAPILGNQNFPLLAQDWKSLEWPTSLAEFPRQGELVQEFFRAFWQCPGRGDPREHHFWGQTQEENKPSHECHSLCRMPRARVVGGTGAIQPGRDTH